jgi:hypothetical protein
VRCCSVLCGFFGRVDGAKHKSMTLVGEVTAEEGREKFLFTQLGIEPATSRLRDEDGTTRPLPVYEQSLHEKRPLDTVTLSLVTISC